MANYLYYPCANKGCVNRLCTALGDTCADHGEHCTYPVDESENTARRYCSHTGCMAEIGIGDVFCNTHTPAPLLHCCSHPGCVIPVSGKKFCFAHDPESPKPTPAPASLDIFNRLPDNKWSSPFGTLTSAKGNVVDPNSRYYDAGGIETIDVIKAKLTPEQLKGYLLGNVIKYSCRLNYKGSAQRDAEKLKFYSQWLSELKGDENEEHY